MKYKNTLPYNTNLVSVASGSECYIINNLLRDNDVIFHVACDDASMSRMLESFKFFAPDIDIIAFPAWDCLPYDRISPNSGISAQRIDSLYKLTQIADRKTIVLTTINASLQKVIGPDIITKFVFGVKIGDEINHEDLAIYLISNGYSRNSTVSEPGEFAVRGSIIDIFVSGEKTALRLDFFGTQLESIREFDPLTQISSGVKHKSLIIKPACEVILNDEAINKFKASYSKMFGNIVADDPLYNAVNDGRKYVGLEHWLPLFYDELSSIFEYAPDALVVYDSLTSEAQDERIKMIMEYYQARIDSGDIKGFSGGATYNPIIPELLYYTDGFKPNNIYRLSQFDGEASSVGRIITEICEYKSTPSFFVNSQQEQIAPVELMQEFCRNKLVENSSSKFVIACFSEGSRERVARILTDHEITHKDVTDFKGASKLKNATVGLGVLPLDKGFVADNYIFISEQDIVGQRNLLHNKRKKSKKSDNFISEATGLNIGELIVHSDHGIGRFISLETVDAGGKRSDYMKIAYDGEDLLYVPIANLDLLSRYGSDEVARLDKLGAASWQKRKALIKKRIYIAAEELIKIAAERIVQKAPILDADIGLYDEFCARFPFSETEDQLNAIDEVREDLASGTPMDRLICGDVGFGKTEIALRASFVAISSKNESSQPYQVAIVVPTTLLARQHYKTFKDRFAGMAVRVEQLSRMVSARGTTENKKMLAEGKVDIIIGTHALLAKNVKFANLQLVIVDEEQRFGVGQKEKLKALSKNVHVLTLSATPIPRTLQMSLSGIKTMSLLATPPIDRLAVRTYVMPFDPVVIREAIMREHFRGGQTYYVCPRIKDMDEVVKHLANIVPEIKVVRAHGQMSASELDEIMNDFYDGKFDVLLATTIVESGLDIPSANTIVIHKADMFGLAQLYQLRGRVGRSNTRAYAYLTLPPKRIPTKEATKRLEVMQSLDSLGAGFSVASHDMDIRGFGNLVGEQQSGQVREVGIELYQDMLKETVDQIKKEKMAVDSIHQAVDDIGHWSPIINLGISALIPEEYISDLQLRLGLYKRISFLQSDDDVENFAAELIDRFGKFPEEVENLLDIIKVKIICKQAFIAKLDANSKGITLAFKNDSFPNPDNLINYVTKRMTKFRIRGDNKLVIMKATQDIHQRIKDVKEEVGQIIDLL